MQFFEWLEKHSPGYDKKIFDNFNNAIDGKVHNPFQWRATEKALDTQFSKAPTQVNANVNGSVKQYVITRGDESSNDVHSAPESAEDSRQQETV